jgi:hypothetical protein
MQNNVAAAGIIPRSGEVVGRVGAQEPDRGSSSLPFVDRSGSVHAARLKQQGRRLPLVNLEMLTSTRRLRVEGLLVAFTQRTHSQRAIGVISVQRPRIAAGAAVRAVRRSCGTVGSGQSFAGWISSVAAVPSAPMPAMRWSVRSTRIQCPPTPSGSRTASKSWPFILPLMATCPREGSRRLAVAGSLRIVVRSIVSIATLQWIVEVADLMAL